MVEYNKRPQSSKIVRPTSSGMLCAIDAVLYVAIALITALTGRLINVGGVRLSPLQRPA